MTSYSSSPSGIKLRLPPDALEKSPRVLASFRNYRYSSAVRDPGCGLTALSSARTSSARRTVFAADDEHIGFASERGRRRDTGSSSGTVSSVSKRRSRSFSRGSRSSGLTLANTNTTADVDNRETDMACMRQERCGISTRPGSPLSSTEKSANRRRSLSAALQRSASTAGLDKAPPTWSQQPSDSIESVRQSRMQQALLTLKQRRTTARSHLSRFEKTTGELARAARHSKSSKALPPTVHLGTLSSRGASSTLGPIRAGTPVRAAPGPSRSKVSLTVTSPNGTHTVSGVAAAESARASREPIMSMPMPDPISVPVSVSTSRHVVADAISSSSHSQARTKTPSKRRPSSAVVVVSPASSQTKEDAVAAFMSSERAYTLSSVTPHRRHMRHRQNEDAETTLQRTQQQERQLQELELKHKAMSESPSKAALERVKPLLKPAYRKDGKTRAAVGLQNLGNTCYMNAALQCLCSCTPLLKYFAQHQKEALSMVRSRQDKREDFVVSFVSLLDRIREGSDDSVVEPFELRAVSAALNDTFSGYRQQDAHEYIRFVLDQLSEALNKLDLQERRAVKLLPTDESDSVSSRARVAWLNFMKRENSVISDIFCGQLQSTVTCLDCGQRSVQFDPFFDVALPIPEKEEGGGFQLKRVFGLQPSASKCSLEECFRAWSAEERLTGHDRFFCSVCKKKTDSTKQLSILRFPQVLIVQLKRFYYRSAESEFSAPIRQKLDTHVKVPLTIELSCVASGEAQRLKLADDERNKSQGDGRIYYRHFAQCNHMGGIRAGHYTATVGVRQQESGKEGTSFQYFQCNDSRTTALKNKSKSRLPLKLFSGAQSKGAQAASAAAAAGGPSGLSGSAPYVLFYERVHE